MEKIQSLFLPIAIVIGSYFVGSGFEYFNRAERTISVRGLAEKQVMANVAVWKIHYTVSSDQITEVRSELPKTTQIVIDFLKAQGFSESEISKTSNIKDRQAQEYSDGKGNRYVAYNVVQVTTEKTEKLQQVRELSAELLKSGVVLTSDTVEFYFTKLNDIKPEMLDQATRNAREAAEGFAKSMSIGVGKLKSASQGAFSIENPISSSDGDYGSFSNGSLFKKVRVVTQVEFYIQ